jgi:hypothetical protein
MILELLNAYTEGNFKSIQLAISETVTLSNIAISTR